MSSSEKQRRVALYKFTDVSEEPASFVFGVVKIEEALSFETSVNF
jgi:hypothetical protein